MEEYSDSSSSSSSSSSKESSKNKSNEESSISSGSGSSFNIFGKSSKESPRKNNLMDIKVGELSSNQSLKSKLSSKIQRSMTSSESGLYSSKQLKNLRYDDQNNDADHTFDSQMPLVSHQETNETPSALLNFVSGNLVRRKNV